MKYIYFQWIRLLKNKIAAELRFKEGNTFVPRFTSENGRYLIGYEVQENDENPVIILAER